MFTVNAAYASFEENEKGSIKNGKIADMVIIDKNIFQMDKKKYKRCKSRDDYKRWKYNI